MGRSAGSARTIRGVHHVQRQSTPPPRARSIPILEHVNLGVLASCSPIIACGRAIPARPQPPGPGDHPAPRRVHQLQHRVDPQLAIPAQSKPSPAPTMITCAGAVGNPTNDLMDQRSRTQRARHLISGQLSRPPDLARSVDRAPSTHPGSPTVLTHRRLPDRVFSHSHR